MKYSFIIPVYNRPEEIDELLNSLTQLDSSISFEVVVVEDGSTVRCEEVIEKYIDKLFVSYYYKENSGPGDSRNFGMRVAKGTYFIILDSDCLIPSHYLLAVENYLTKNYVDCFGGPDAAHDSFSSIQKAINVVMTSVLTTGGIRGASETVSKFQPRSFNMGISKEAFESSNGFGKIHPGEDPDLSIRLWNLGFTTALIPEAYVYHKRRIDWSKFHTQVKKFGKARPILNLRYPKYSKITYWFPSLFITGYAIGFILLLLEIPYIFYLFLIYFVLVFVEALQKTKSLTIAGLSIVALHIQFFGYGVGFLYSSYQLFVLKKDPKVAMPEMFFK